jgi:hypothetical protein
MSRLALALAGGALFTGLALVFRSRARELPSKLDRAYEAALRSAAQKDETLEVISNVEARAAHRKQWFQGKNKGTEERFYSWPYINDADDDFVLLDVPVGDLNALATSHERAEGYAEVLKKTDMGPSWGHVSRRSRDGAPPVYLKDGNHRAIAAMLIGRKSVKVMLPVTSYYNYLARKLGSP